MNKEKRKEDYTFDRFLIDRNDLRNATYSSKGVYSRAILALYAHKQPKDWKHTDKDVIVDNLFFSIDKPNLHHIFPTNYILHHPGQNKLNNNSLMNIAYLTQQTNLGISDRPPLEYIGEFIQNPDFEKVIASHLLPPELLEWARMEKMPDNALDQFIERRVDLILGELKGILAGVKFEVTDTKEKEPTTDE